MSRINSKHISKKTPKVSSSADEARGKRLEDFLQKVFPEMSWNSRSKELGFIDNTVIGWRKGREIPGSGLIRLHELGCDILWLLSGSKDVEGQKSPTQSVGEKDVSLKLYASLEEAHKALSILAEKVASGEIDLDDAHRAVAEASKIVWQVHGTPAKSDKRQNKQADKNGTGTAQ